jgi:hypothetical protein
VVTVGAILDPRGNSVFCFQVSSSGIGDCLWCRKLMVLPFKTTINHPLQDTRPFSPQLFGKLFISFLRRDRHGERQQIEPSPYSLINTTQSRLMVAGNHQFELGRKLKRNPAA